MNCQRLLELFWGWCEENRAPNTVRHYRSRLKSFGVWFGERELRGLTPLEVEEWLRAAGRKPDGKPMANDTRRANIISFQRLQTWAIERKELDAPTLARIEKPPSTKRSRIPTPEETAAILRDATPEFRLAYRALRMTGARPGELAAMKIEDWNRAGNVIVLTEHKTKRKTGLDRRIAVGEKLLPLLQEAAGDRTAGPLFLTPQGKGWKTSSLSQTYRRLRKRAGLPDDLVLYLARHEHATQLCKKLDVFAASKALGHSNIKTTADRYIKVDDDTLRRNQDAFEE
jgi:integrase